MENIWKKFLRLGIESAQIIKLNLQLRKSQSVVYYENNHFNHCILMQYVFVCQ
jgi:hypothetical protein